MSDDGFELPSSRATHLHVVAIYVFGSSVEEQHHTLEEDMARFEYEPYQVIYNDKDAPGGFIEESPYYETYFKGRWTATVYSDKPAKWGRVIIKYLPTRTSPAAVYDYLANIAEYERAIEFSSYELDNCDEF